MTEEQWLASRDPGPMVAYLWSRRPAAPRNARKLRLLGCVCVRAIWSLLRQPGSRDALATAELYADGKATADDLWQARLSAMAAFAAESYSPHWHAAQAAQHLTVKTYNGGTHPSFAHAIRSAGTAWAMERVRSGAGPDQEAEFQVRQAVHADWLRDIFGNPFRPVASAARWRTHTVVSLAKHMYESREFDAMPIFADALEEASCNCEDMLNHCRDANQVHVRGCWVVDLILGKTRTC